MSTDDVTWETMRVPGFDEMVTRDQLFPLCVFIGNAIFKQNPTVVGFEGPGPSGKSTMCSIIQKIAEKNNINSVFISDDEEIGLYLQRTIKHSSICYSMNDRSVPSEMLGHSLVVWKDRNRKEHRSYWRAPTFFCSNVAIQQPGVYVIRFAKMNTMVPNFEDSIDIDLVEKKCLFALSMCRTPDLFRGANFN